jgi:hypothetical protein
VLSPDAYPTLRENYREVPLATRSARLFVPAPTP